MALANDSNYAESHFDDSQEGFIDVDVNGENIYLDRIVTSSCTLGVDDKQGKIERTPNADQDEDSQLVETEPLIINDGGRYTKGDIKRESNSLVTPSKSTANVAAENVATQMRSRRTKSGAFDSWGENDIKPPTAYEDSCFRKKNSWKDNNGIGSTEGAEHSAHDTSSILSQNNEGSVSGGPTAALGCGRVRRFCCDSSSHLVRTTVSVMNLLARILLWGSFLAMVVGVVWYSRELKMNGTDPHLIAWFSAGAFVLLGFPISMCGIFLHLTNYYQPNVQCYVVRILWMVPIYSIESWLCLRFHTLAIYIETLRDCYESYVLYSFLQFLIEVLGGEEALVLMLKDKSPTRGVHMTPLNWCVKPWLMGQPVSRRISFTPDKRKSETAMVSLIESENGPSASSGLSTPLARPVKRVQWTSPFFVKCKFGVLQYVLLKFVSAIFVMVLEIYGIYKEGDFTPRGGYLYICILTNLSQCWALYCLVFFYYATKNELGPIRPVGKFLSVKAVVFFTWWQSLGISILFQMGMIPHYAAVDDGREWTSEAVAKGLQDYLICIEMFVAAIVHTFVFPHTDYLEPLGIINQRRGPDYMAGVRRLGRKGRFWGSALSHQYRRGDDRSACSKSSGGLDPSESLTNDLELGSVDSLGGGNRLEEKLDARSKTEYNYPKSDLPHSSPARQQRQGFVRALLDSTVPRDVFGETVGMVKGEFHVEKKTLLHHAATSDEYDLFSKSSKRRRVLSKGSNRASDKSLPTVTNLVDVYPKVPDSIKL